MNQMTKTTAIITVLLTACLTTSYSKEVPYLKIIKSIEQVESSGRLNVIGLAGEVGCMQISDIMRRHVNNLAGQQYTQQDLYKRNPSYKICYFFLVHEVSRYRRKYGVTPSMKKIVSAWNSGSIMKSTREKYSNKVLAHFYSK